MALPFQGNGRQKRVMGGGCEDGCFRPGILSPGGELWLLYPSGRVARSPFWLTLYLVTEILQSFMKLSGISRICSLIT